MKPTKHVLFHRYENFLHLMTSDMFIILLAGFFQSVLGTRFGSLELKIGSLESEKIIIGSLESKKIGSLESENRVPTGSYRVPNIFLKKPCY